MSVNTSLLQPKRGIDLLKLKITPLDFLLKHIPWFVDKIFFFRPTERIVEYPFVHEYISFGVGNGRILDVGSGSTLLPFELASKGWEVWALDLEMGYFKALHHANCTFIKGDIRKTNFSDDFFDVVTAVSSIEHVGLESSVVDLDGDKKAIQEIDRILKPEGMLLMTVPFGKGGVYYHKRKKNYPLFRVYDLSAINEVLSPLEIETMKFALLDNDMSWIPCKAGEAELIDSLNQPGGWYSAKAVALVVAKKRG